MDILRETTATKTEFFWQVHKKRLARVIFIFIFCPVEEESYKDFIVLRDFLRNNPKKAQEYLNKKCVFAKEANFDRKKYKNLKSAYVSKLLIEAKK